MDEANEITETSATQETQSAQEATPAASYETGTGRWQDYDPFAREYNVPWDQIEAEAETARGGDAEPTGRGDVGTTEQSEPSQIEAETERPASDGSLRAPVTAEADQSAVEAGRPSDAVTTEAQATSGPVDYAAQIEQWGGAPVVELLKPLFTPVTDLESATDQAAGFVESIGKFDPLMRTALANAFYNSFKGDYFQWANADKGITPETWNAFEQWQAAGSTAPTRASEFPQPGPDNSVVFHEPDGREYEFDLNDPIHRELYEARKERFERAEQRKREDTRTAEQRTILAERQREQRVYDYAAARDQAFTQAWDEAKPDYGPDPDLQFLGSFARVYAQHIAGTNPEALRLHSEAIRLAADGGTGAEAKAAKMDLLMRKDIKSALETIDKVVRRVAARQTSAQAGQPKLPPGAVRTGVVRQGTPPEPGPTRRGGRLSLDDPDSFAAIHIPWPKS